MKKMLLAFITILVSISIAQAQNKPCSGKKGGIDRCVGDKFKCRDGSISASKKNCSTYR